MGTGTRGVAGMVGNAALTLASVAGLICILLVAAAFLFNVTLIMFKTGSMAPTIPAGSLSLVREIAAAEIRVGDVVTVARGDALPITHRVVSVAAGPSVAERVITMKGDANVAADAHPYTVSTVRIVLGSAPGLASVVVWFSTPWVLGSLALGASALVTWAFWPRDDRGGPRGPGARPLNGVGGGDAPRAEPSPRRVASSGIRRRATHGFVAGLACAALLVAGHASVAHASAATAPAGHASAATAVQAAYPSPPPDLTPDQPTERVITDGGLTLVVIGDQNEMANLDPDESVLWTVGVIADESERGDVHVTLAGVGSAGLSLHSIVRSCAERFVGPECASGATLVQPASAVAIDGVERAVALMSAAETRWFSFELWRYDTDRSAKNDTVALALHAFGSSDDVSTTSGHVGALPRTGVDAFAPLLVAAGAIGLGLLLAFGATVRTRLRGRP